MKRFFVGLAAALFSAMAFGTTLSPITLLNPAGSTAGQAILSTGASSAPGWGNVPISAVTGGLSAATAASTYLTQANAASTYATITNLALKAPLASPTFTGTVTIPTGASIAGFAPLASPTFTGTVTAAAVTATGLISPSSTVGVKGTATNDSAQAGSIGEYPTPVTTGPTSMSNVTSMNATSISLTAGDWDVWGVCQFTPAGTTTVTLWTCGISTTSATRPAGISQEAVVQYSTAVTGVGNQFPTPMTRISIASTTTVYVVALSSFATSTQTATGFIAARRIR